MVVINLWLNGEVEEESQRSIEKEAKITLTNRQGLLKNNEEKENDEIAPNATNVT